MLRRSACLTPILCLAIAFAQDAFSSVRTYKVGDKDVYALSMAMKHNTAEAVIRGKVSYEVKKTYENGDADIETRSFEVSVNAMGTEMKQPDSPAKSFRYDRYGTALEKNVPIQERQPYFMKFMTYRPIAPLKVGETVKVKEMIDEDSNSEVKGTAKLESLKDGIAKIVSVLDITRDKKKKPIRLESNGYFDAATSKLIRSESKFTSPDNLEIPGLPPIRTMTIVVEKQK
jgi:hypothetical protein